MMHALPVQARIEHRETPPTGLVLAGATYKTQSAAPLKPYPSKDIAMIGLMRWRVASPIIELDISICPTNCQDGKAVGQFFWRVDRSRWKAIEVIGYGVQFTNRYRYTRTL